MIIIDTETRKYEKVPFMGKLGYKVCTVTVNERFYKTMRSQPNLTKNSKICKLRLVDRWSLLFYD
ncbi:hypothetical protein SAMN02910276_01892 [Butyrivibrio sp. Su6]|nr:hypothetical protein SAMN02910276_01892 [Butyrivibrio sp. Su6]